MTDEKTNNRILLALDRNSRATFASIAKQLKMPQQTVRYRVQRLCERGVIQQFLTVFNLGRVGLYYYKIFLKLHNVNAKKLELVIKDLIARDAVNWVVEVDGVFDIGFTVYVRNPVELSQLIDELRSEYRSFIHTQAFSVNIHMQFMSRDYLSGRRKGSKSLGEYTASEELVSVDTLDWGIIRELSQNSRKSNVEIAESLDSVPETIAHRIRRLEKNDIIVRYSLVLDLERLALLNYYVLIYLNNITPELERAFVTHCKAKPQLVYVIKALGEWDYELNLEVRSVDEYRQIMMELTDTFSEVVREYRGMFVSKIRKFVYP